jgi:hypothetical protein
MKESNSSVSSGASPGFFQTFTLSRIRHSGRAERREPLILILRAARERAASRRMKPGYGPHGSRRAYPRGARASRARRGAPHHEGSGSAPVSRLESIVTFQIILASHQPSGLCRRFPRTRQGSGAPTGAGVLARHPQRPGCNDDAREENKVKRKLRLPVDSLVTAACFVGLACA